MIHPERDQDLLLLAHGQLGSLAALRTRRHLARCPDCRRRLAQLEAASRGLADALRDPGSPRWSPRAASASPFTALLLCLILVTAVLLVIVLGTLAVRTHTPTARSVPAGGCRPDLPNDRCR